MLPALGCYIAAGWLLNHPKCPRGLEPTVLVLMLCMSMGSG
jgi:hypothetical protein